MVDILYSKRFQKVFIMLVCINKQRKQTKHYYVYSKRGYINREQIRHHEYGKSWYGSV